MDLDPDPDPTPFFVDFKDAEKNNFLRYFCLAHRHIIFSLKNLFFSKNFVLKSYLARICTSDSWIRIRILEAQKHADPVPQLWSKSCLS
jgi:hypothetical protein